MIEPVYHRSPDFPANDWICRETPPLHWVKQENEERLKYMADKHSKGLPSLISANKYLQFGNLFSSWDKQELEGKLTTLTKKIDELDASQIRYEKKYWWANFREY